MGEPIKPPSSGTLQKHKAAFPSKAANADAHAQNNAIVSALHMRSDAQPVESALPAKKQSGTVKTPKQFVRAEIKNKIICVRCKADMDAKHPETAAFVAKTRDAAPYESFCELCFLLIHDKHV